MNKAKTIIFITLIFTFLKVECQESIPEAKLKFNLPNKHWKLNAKESPNTGTVIYSYKREPILNAANVSIIPNITFIIEDLPYDNIDIIGYSIMKRENVPMKILETFTNTDKRLKLKNAVAYKAIYKDPLEHTIYIIHLINNHKGIQVFMDITSDSFKIYENEFIKSMESLSVISL
jgi:hypothetical protein